MMKPVPVPRRGASPTRCRPRSIGSSSRSGRGGWPAPSGRRSGGRARRRVDVDDGRIEALGDVGEVDGAAAPADARREQRRVVGPTSRHGAIATAGCAAARRVGTSDPATMIPTSKPIVAVSAAVTHANRRVMIGSL